MDVWRLIDLNATELLTCGNLSNFKNCYAIMDNFEDKMRELNNFGSDV